MRFQTSVTFDWEHYPVYTDLSTFFQRGFLSIFHVARTLYQSSRSTTYAPEEVGCRAGVPVKTHHVVFKFLLGEAGFLGDRSVGCMIEAPR
jgi:hypothetical protein